MSGEKAHIKFFLIMTMAAISAMHGSGMNYYVATNGSDVNSGTSTNTPWRTVQKAANTLAPGDIVLVRAGVYNERVTVNVSGDSLGGRVVFQNFPGELPVIDGTGLAVPSGDN